MSNPDKSFTEPIMNIEGIEPSVIAHLQSLFDNVLKKATEQICTNLSSVVDNLFDVYVNYMKTISTTKAYSTANYDHLGEKYIPLAFVENGARVMQTKLRQLMSTEVEQTTSSKLSDMFKAPFRLPLYSNDSDDDDDDDDQQETDTQAILDQLEKYLEDMSDLDEEEEEDDDNENADQNKRKRNQEKRQTELSCETIAQMAVLIHKLERYQLAEQTKLLRRLEKLNNKKIDPQLNQQPGKQTSGSSSTSVSYEQSQLSHYETNQHGLEQLKQSESTDQKLSKYSSTATTSTSSDVHQSQIHFAMSLSPKPNMLHLIQPESDGDQLVKSMTNQQHSTSTNKSVITDQPNINQNDVLMSNPSITNQVPNDSNLPSPTDELFDSATLCDESDNLNNESDDDVVFLEEVASTRSNQNGQTVPNGDVSAPKSSQPVGEQAGGNVNRLALISKRILMDQHLLSVHGILPYNCLLTCGAKFATLEDVTAHIGEQHPEIKLFPCRFHCPKNLFTNYSALYMHHEYRHTQLGVFGCSESNCSYKVGWMNLLELANRTIDQNFYFSCSGVVCPIRGCARKLDSALAAKQHLKTHREDGPFVCSLCNETFSQKQSCRDHIRNKHFQRQVNSKLVYVDNHIQVCGPLSVEEQPAQLMDDLFIQPTTRGVQRAATIVSIKRIQVDRNVGSISSPSTTSLGQEAIQSVEASKLAQLTSVSTSSKSSANSINNSGKRNLSTSDETRRPSKIHKSLPEPSLKTNQSFDNPTTQPRPSLQLKPANLDCPHCSKRFDARTALNLHILANHKCSPVQSRQFVCAFVGCWVSMSGCRLSDVLWHVAIVHHHTTGNPCEFFDIQDK